jgi:hypothetical protein
VWRYMLAVAAVPTAAMFVGMLRMPESPRWLISKNRHDEALAVLCQVRDERRARAELAEVEFLHEEEEQSKMGAGRTSGSPESAASSSPLSASPSHNRRQASTRSCTTAPSC